MTITNVNIVAIQEELTCPVERQGLLKGISLIPCMHKVNETALNKLRDACPVCNGVICGWKEDPTIRALARLAFVAIDSELHPYPGYRSALRLREKVIFPKTHTSAGLTVEEEGRSGNVRITGFVLSRMADSAPFTMEVYFEGEAFKNYFRGLGMEVKGSGRGPYCEANTPEKTQKLFQIIADNNTLSADDHAYVYRIVHAEGQK